MAGYDIFIGYMVQGLFTGMGVAVGTWIYKKYLEPGLEKQHEHLSKIPIRPVKLNEPNVPPPKDEIKILRY